jgi:Colicin V production protein
VIALPSLPSYWPVALALVTFGAIGLRRGWVRELASLGLVLLDWLIVFAFGLSIVDLLNRIALIVTFTWRGGFDAADPGGLLRALRSSPPIDRWHPEWLYLLIFGLGGAAAYALSNRLTAGADRAPGSAADAVLGGLIGAVNGYLLAYVGLGYLHGALRAPASEPLAILGGYATTLAVAVVAAAVAFALIASTRAPGLKAKRSGRASA